MTNNIDPDSLARLLRRRAVEGELTVPVRGTSMGRQLQTGDRVRVGRWDRPRVGQIWAFVSDDGDVLVHRIRHLDGDVVVARGVGNEIDDAPVTGARLVGPVTTRLLPDGRTVEFGSTDRWKAAISFSARRWGRRALRQVLRQRGAVGKMS